MLLRRGRRGNPSPPRPHRPKTAQTTGNGPARISIEVAVGVRQLMQEPGNYKSWSIYTSLKEGARNDKRCHPALHQMGGVYDCIDDHHDFGSCSQALTGPSSPPTCQTGLFPIMTSRVYSMCPSSTPNICQTGGWADKANPPRLLVLSPCQAWKCLANTRPCSTSIRSTRPSRGLPAGN